LQTGDPKGDGTGGESIWGGEFDDEFVRTLRWVGSLSVDFGVFLCVNRELKLCFM
jgi:cyclophilin family peptidyl-prolyl cis-trans isomerase